MIPSRVPPTVAVGDCDRSGPAPWPAGTFANPKSRTFTTPSGVILMFAGFKSRVNDSFLVRRFQCLGNLLPDGERLTDRNRPLGDPVSERRPVDQLQHKGLNAIRFLKAVDAADVRMVQRGEHQGFALEPGEAIGIEREGFGEDL